MSERGRGEKKERGRGEVILVQAVKRQTLLLFFYSCCSAGRGDICVWWSG